MAGLRFKHLVFDETFLFAQRETGEKLKFTRAERALLLAFTANVHKLLTRGQLLDAMPSIGSDISDRNIDNLVNRLRTKLGDSARSPSWIVTQYGEGYLWIAEPIRADVPREDCLLVIGPVSGLDRAAAPQQGYAWLRSLQAALAAAMGDDQHIALDGTWAPGTDRLAEARFSLDVGFYDDGKRLHCAAVLWQASSRQMLMTHRLSLDPAGTIDTAEMERLVAGIASAIWQHETAGLGILVGPADIPPELQMRDASRLLMRSDENWVQMGEELAHSRLERLDAEANLMWAMHLYGRITTNPADIARHEEIHSQIETIVFDHLAIFQHNPIFLLGAAKLLLFIGRGHLGLAEQLAEEAFSSSAAFAASFATLGQVRACRGDLAAAVDLYDRGIDLAEPGSEFQIYLMVLKSIALLANDDRPALNQVLARLYALKPVTRFYVGLSMAPDGPLPLDLEMLVSQYDAARAGHGITYLHHVFGRLLEREEHRENLMRGLIANLTRRFGSQIVAEEVWRSVQRLRPSEGNGRERVGAEKNDIPAVFK